MCTSVVCLRTWYEPVDFNFIIGKFCYCGFMGRLAVRTMFDGFVRLQAVCQKLSWARK